MLTSGGVGVEFIPIVFCFVVFESVCGFLIYKYFVKVRTKNYKEFLERETILIEKWEQGRRESDGY